MSDIRFKPWVGDRYGCGIVGYDADGKIIYGTENHIGKRVLVLGESHYCANPEAEATPFLTIIYKNSLVSRKKSPNSFVIIVVF